MKSYWAVLLVGFLFCVAFINIPDSNFEVPEVGITFHSVNLVCGAATDIGCGSRSKPILLDLQKEPSIKEAWLNRAGTIVAVVWKKDVEPNVKIVPASFKKHGKSMETLSGSIYQEQLNSFKNDRWYKGKEVDELSMEEAGRIAQDIIDPMVKDRVLSKEKSKVLFVEIEQYIQNQFMTLEDVSLLSTTTYYDQWETDIQSMIGKYMPKDEVPKIEMCSSNNATCKSGEKCCSSNKCCSSSSWWSSLFN